MTWEIGKDSFAVGLWQISPAQKDQDSESDVLYAFCRAQGTVSAHWEGTTLVLASTISSQGGADAIRVMKKVEGPKTTRRTMDRGVTCSASFAALRITFEIVDKDAKGPTRLRAKSDDTVVELARGDRQSEIVPKPIVEAVR